MNRNFFISFFAFFFTSITLLGQTISVDDTSRNKNDLVDLLIGNSCISRTDISLSSTKSVAYFNNNNGIFPISEGIIIRNGIAEYSQGSYTNENLSSEVSTNGDAQLQEISDESGQSSTITDVAFLEFDFIPLATDLNFNFLFASNEYGEFQCGFSDVFAILLTNIDTGETINLAVLPNTNTNVSVKNIRDGQYNGSCSSINPDLFSTYNVNNASNSSLNMRGHSIVMNASATVVPNDSYRIKFALGDYNDSSYDSAVFIEAGSFDAKINLGEDQRICSGNEIILDSGYTDNSNYSYRWKKDGNTILGEVNATLTVTEKGTYDIIVTNLATDCVLEDQIIIYDLEVTAPKDLTNCYTGNTVEFNLTENNYASLGIEADKYIVNYYNSLDNVNNNIPINQDEIENYSSAGNEKIYIKLKDKNTDNSCDLISDFDLLITKVEGTTPDNILVCESDSSVNLPEKVESQLLGNLDTSNHIVNYFTSSDDANNNTNQITTPTSFPLPNNTDSIDIWARIINKTNNCFDIVTFVINFSDLPMIDSLINAEECTEYILPELTNGNYYTGSNGTGIQLSPGDVITEESTLFIYNENSNGCSNQSSFVVYIANDFSIPLEYCGEFIVPAYPNALFYTETNGSNGNGTVIPAGTALTTSQTIYFYVEIEGAFCIENEYEITIKPRPPVDSFDNVITCNSYTLPNITNGGFYSGANGSGIKLNPGDEITRNRIIYVYNQDTETNCSNTSSFFVLIINLNSFQDINVCGSYSIPYLSIGSYYTEANGGGIRLAPEETITEDKTIYYYASEITTFPNCSENTPINISIKSLPQVDKLDDIIKCENDLPTLPALVNGNYFTESNGLGTQLSEGDTISSSQTIYIYNTDEDCANEESFYVDIRPIPMVDNFTDVFSCDPYVLPMLTYGKYFTASGGQGTQLNAGDVIETTQTLYIYNQDNTVNTCDNENIFKVNILGINVDTPEDVIACESHTLPTLTVGDYFTEPEGEGTKLNAGDIIETTQTLYIYAENGMRFFCSDEHVFTINIFEKPILNEIENIEGCGSVTLPTLTLSDTTIEYYKDIDRTTLINPSEYTITDVGTQDIYVHAYPTGNPDCFTDASFKITVHPLLDLEIENGVICVDSETGKTTNSFLLQSKLDPNEFTVEWFFDGELVGTGENFNATSVGTYRVETTKLKPETGTNCNYKPTEVSVISSNPGFEVDFLTADFAENSAIVVKTINTGLGSYTYALDNGDFQTSNEFYNITPGDYTITVRDLSVICNDIILNFNALEYPLFFTPNDDGVNDTWNISDLRNNVDATIKIFSRHGKLMATIKPNGEGWDGTNSNGHKAISTDYWFIVEYTKEDGLAEYKGHFALLRK